jgi:hypothetical protein
LEDIEDYALEMEMETAGAKKKVKLTEWTFQWVVSGLLWSWIQMRFKMSFYVRSDVE